MYINGSTNITPEHSMICQFSKDTSMNTISYSGSLDKLNKKYSSCRLSYVPYKKKKPYRLKPVDIHRSSKKVTIDYLQDYNQQNKAFEPIIPEYSAEYHNEMKDCQQSRCELIPTREKLTNKLLNIPELESFPDLLISADSFGKMVYAI